MSPAFFVLATLLAACADSGSVQKRESDGADRAGPIENLFRTIGVRQPVDFILVMDRSHSMSKEDFYLQQKKLAEAILKQHASLYTSYVRLAVLTFARDVTVVIDGITRSDSTPNKCTLFLGADPLWDRVEYTRNESQLKGTNMKDAFIMARDIYLQGRQQRPDAEQVMLVISDGKYNQDSDPINEVKELHSLGVTIYGVGMGKWVEHGNVRVVTSHVNDTYLYGKYDDWKKLLTEGDRITSYGPDKPRFWISYEDEGGEDVKPIGNAASYCDIDRGIQAYLCNQGYYYDPDNETCVACPTGTYKMDIGNELQCIRCPPGMTTDGVGSVINNSCKCTKQNCTDPCLSASCNDHQRCEAINETTSRCICLEGWQGKDCQQNEDACVSNSAKCQHHSKCLDGLGKDVFTCVCTDWAYYGRYCQFEKNECTEDMCFNNATCEDRLNNFHCNCTGDWIGRYCQDKEGVASTTPQVVTIINVITSTSKKPDNTLWIIIGACIGGGLFIVIIITTVAVCISHRRKQKNKQEVKSIAQQFSGFWKKRTLRGSKYIKEMEEDSQAGLPSAPSAHRPDLIESTAVYDELKTDEYAELPFQTMTLKTGMESWHSYISELETSKVIDRALIVKLGGEKKTMTSAWMFDPAEVSRLQELMAQGDENVPLLLQEAEYHIQENDGTMAIGKTIGSSQEPRVIAIGKTKTYLIVAVALAATDKGKVRKEVQWIVDHITGEGY